MSCDAEDPGFDPSNEHGPLDPEPVEGIAWGGPVDGQALVAWEDPGRLYTVRGAGRLVTLVDGTTRLQAYELARAAADGRLSFHRTVAGYYMAEGGAGGARVRFRYVDFEGRRRRRPPPDPALDCLEGLG